MMQTILSSKLSPGTVTAFSPTIQLVGGAGNTTPTFTTNTAVSYEVDKKMHVQYYFAGNGGTAGAGTGAVCVNLPVAANANQVGQYIPIGYLADGTGGGGYKRLYGTIAGTGTYIQLFLESVVSGFRAVTGNDFSTPGDRQISLQIEYLI